MKKETAGLHKQKELGSSSFISEGKLGGLRGGQLGEKPRKKRGVGGGGVVGNKIIKN